MRVTKVSTSDLCTCWARALIALVNFIDGRQMMNIINVVRFRLSLVHLLDDE
jgi:hypothetical protein